jgi:hypothetical protein
MRLGENFSHMVCGLTSAYSATMIGLLERIGGKLTA